MGGQHHAPAALPPESTRYPLYRRLGEPQGRSGRVRKISPSPGFDSRTGQPATIAIPTVLSEPPYHWAPGAISPGVNGQVVYLNKPPSSAEVKKGGDVPPLPLYAVMAYPTFPLSGNRVLSLHEDIQAHAFYGQSVLLHLNVQPIVLTQQSRSQQHKSTANNTAGYIAASFSVPFLYFALYHGETSPRSPIAGQGSQLTSTQQLSRRPYVSPQHPLLVSILDIEQFMGT